VSISGRGDHGAFDFGHSVWHAVIRCGELVMLGLTMKDSVNWIESVA